MKNVEHVKKDMKTGIKIKRKCINLSKKNSRSTSDVFSLKQTKGNIE